VYYRSLNNEINILKWKKATSFVVVVGWSKNSRIIMQCIVTGREDAQTTTDHNKAS
jgi:hypothetical protein